MHRYYIISYIFISIYIIHFTSDYILRFNNEARKCTKCISEPKKRISEASYKNVVFFFTAKHFFYMTYALKKTTFSLFEK